MKSKVFLLLGVMALILGASAADAAQSSYAADLISTNGSEEFSGRFYFQDGNVRMEMGPMITITRMDKKVVWVVMSDQNMYMEQPVSLRDVVASGAANSSEIRRTPLGTEIVGGRPVNKFEVVYQIEGAQSTVLEWMDPAWPMPVKMAAPDSSWSMEYRNIRTGPQDAALFEVPAGCQKFAVPGMPAGLGALAGAQS